MTRVIRFVRSDVVKQYYLFVLKGEIGEEFILVFPKHWGGQNQSDKRLEGTCWLRARRCTAKIQTLVTLDQNKSEEFEKSNFFNLILLKIIYSLKFMFVSIRS